MKKYFFVIFTLSISCVEDVGRPPDGMNCPGDMYCPCSPANNPPCNDGFFCRRDLICSVECISDNDCIGDIFDGTCVSGVCALPCEAEGEPCETPETTCEVIELPDPILLCRG